MKKIDAIFILGPQGSGKGTQGRLLAEKLGFFFWEMGGVLRANRDFVLADGEKVGEILDRGAYLSDAQLFEILNLKPPDSFSINSVSSGSGACFTVSLFNSKSATA